MLIRARLVYILQNFIYLNPFRVASIGDSVPRTVINSIEWSQIPLIVTLMYLRRYALRFAYISTLNPLMQIDICFFKSKNMFEATKAEEDRKYELGMEVYKGYKPQ